MYPITKELAGKAAERIAVIEASPLTYSAVERDNVKRELLSFVCDVAHSMGDLTDRGAILRFIDRRVAEISTRRCSWPIGYRPSADKTSP